MKSTTNRNGESVQARTPEFERVTPEAFVRERDRGARRIIRFHDRNADANDSFVPAGLFLTPRSAADFRHRRTRTFLSNRANAGFALTSDDELENLFAIHGNGTGVRAVVQAVALGATHLTVIGEPLVEFYSRLGWIEATRIAFDPKRAPDRWPYDALGTPEVIAMEFWRATSFGGNEGQRNSLRVCP